MSTSFNGPPKSVKRSKYDSYKNFVKMVYPDGGWLWVHKDEVKSHKKYGGKVVRKGWNV